jgi:hypothetical protein|tara:strand:- start:337 stop:492 length:156 start_codon:yes stop_codon:yes gene_type:complete
MKDKKYTQLGSLVIKPEEKTSWKKNLLLLLIALIGWFFILDMFLTELARGY